MSFIHKSTLREDDFANTQAAWYVQQAENLPVEILEQSPWIIEMKSPQFWHKGPVSQESIYDAPDADVQSLQEMLKSFFSHPVVQAAHRTAMLEEHSNLDADDVAQAEAIRSYFFEYLLYKFRDVRAAHIARRAMDYMASGTKTYVGPEDPAFLTDLHTELYPLYSKK